MEDFSNFVCLVMYVLFVILMPFQIVIDLVEMAYAHAIFEVNLMMIFMDCLKTIIVFVILIVIVIIKAIAIIVLIVATVVTIMMTIIVVIINHQLFRYLLMILLLNKKTCPFFYLCMAVLLYQLNDLYYRLKMSLFRLFCSSSN